MTDTQIKEQIETIKRVSAEVRQLKESARKFLVDAGIIKDKPVKPLLTKSKV